MSIVKVQPTRMELIKLKRRIKMAKRGHDLLKKKRDGLIMEFRELLEEAKKVIGGMAEKYEKAQQKLALAIAVDGIVAVKSIALSRQCEPRFVMMKKNIMGVVVPVIKREEKIIKCAIEREYGVIGTTARIDEAVQAYEALVDAILEVAEVETTVRKLIEEIEKTKRRVNALEYRVIPMMEEAAKFISFKLEEQDRESIIRLKKLKSKKAKAQS